MFYIFSQSLWYISQIILDISKPVSAFVKTIIQIETAKHHGLLTKASLLLKILHI